MIPMSLSFEDYLTCDYGEQWASPIDLRYLFDGLAIWPGLVWITSESLQVLRAASRGPQ